MIIKRSVFDSALVSQGDIVSVKVDGGFLYGYRGTEWCPPNDDDSDLCLLVDELEKLTPTGVGFYAVVEFDSATGEVWGRQPQVISKSCSGSYDRADADDQHGDALLICIGGEVKESVIAYVEPWHPQLDEFIGRGVTAWHAGAPVVPVNVYHGHGFTGSGIRLEARIIAVYAGDDPAMKAFFRGHLGGESIITMD